jgi:anti-sigma factor RsiW
MIEPAELTCQELVELVTDYLEGALTEEDRARFEAHVDDCEGCARFLEQMRTTIRLTGALTVDSIPSGAHAELLRAFRDWKRR